MSQVERLLWIGDDALVASLRLGEWVANAPDLEEDVALANIALDQLGVARAVLAYAGEVEGAGRDEDALAYRRDDREFRNCLLVELPNGDFAVTIAKLLALSGYQKCLYDRLSTVDDVRLAGIAGKARLESTYHFDHSAQWTRRLGDGTEESHRRMRAAIDEIWPYTGELFEHDAALRPLWTEMTQAVLTEAMLTAPTVEWGPTGGRHGRHTEHLGRLLAEAQSVHRAHPGATW